MKHSPRNASIKAARTARAGFLGNGANVDRFQLARIDSWRMMRRDAQKRRRQRKRKGHLACNRSRKKERDKSRLMHTVSVARRSIARTLTVTIPE